MRERLLNAWWTLRFDGWFGDIGRVGTVGDVGCVGTVSEVGFVSETGEMGIVSTTGLGLSAGTILFLGVGFFGVTETWTRLLLFGLELRPGVGPLDMRGSFISDLLDLSKK